MINSFCPLGLWVHFCYLGGVFLMWVLPHLSSVVVPWATIKYEEVTYPSVTSRWCWKPGRSAGSSDVSSTSWRDLHPLDCRSRRMPILEPCVLSPVHRNPWKETSRLSRRFRRLGGGRIRLALLSAIRFSHFKKATEMTYVPQRD